jgi:hypothetical protein
VYILLDALDRPYLKIPPILHSDRRLGWKIHISSAPREAKHGFVLYTDGQMFERNTFDANERCV